MTSAAPDWGALQRAIAGDVVLPGLRDYESVRKSSIARFHDVRPRAVVLCRTPEFSEEEQARYRTILRFSPADPWCRKAKRYMKEREIPSKEVNVERDQEAAPEMVQKTGQKGDPGHKDQGQVDRGLRPAGPRRE